MERNIFKSILLIILLHKCCVFHASKAKPSVCSVAGKLHVEN